MNEALRWKLLLGCLVLAAIELPDDAEVLAHDLHGPYCACPGVVSEIPANFAVLHDSSSAFIAGDTGRTVRWHGSRAALRANASSLEAWETAAASDVVSIRDDDTEAIFDDSSLDETRSDDERANERADFGADDLRR